MKRAIELSEKSMRNGGGPFGAVIVKDGKVVGEGMNGVVPLNDPTAHAEVVAIRNACENLATFDLSGSVIFTSCEPCPMCLGAIYWARPSKIYYANTRHDAAASGFDDSMIYDEIKADPDKRKIPMIHLKSDKAQSIFEQWNNKVDKTEY